MSLRIYSLSCALALLAACEAGEVQPQAAEGAETIECAIGPGAEFGPDCLVERVSDGDEPLLVVRHPDGGFRRFVVLPAGAGLGAFDGADELEQALDGDVLTVTAGADRYRFPATGAGDDGRP